MTTKGIERVQKILNAHPEWIALYGEGFASPFWLEYLEEIKTRFQYLKVVAEYIEFHQLRKLADDTALDTTSIVEFFKARYEMKNENGEKKFKANTLQGHLSVMNKFWMYAYARDLSIELPLLQHKIKSWNADMDDPIQAAAFTIEELNEYYAILPGVHTAHIGPYAILATHGCERGIEIKSLRFEDVVELTDTATGNKMFQIFFDRAKQLGKKTGKKGNALKSKIFLKQNSMLYLKYS